jgi:adenylate cyclase
MTIPPEPEHGTPPEPTESTPDIRDWLTTEALAVHELPSLVNELCRRLADGGVPLARAYIALPTLHPSFEGIGCRWRRTGETAVEEYEHGGSHNLPFQQSPILHCIRNELPLARWRLDVNDLDPRFPVLAELRDAGMTDYAILLRRFGSYGNPLALPGIVSTWATERAGGFADGDIATLSRVLPTLALAAYRVLLQDVTIDLLDAYVGRDAGRRILGGQVQRGSVDRVTAVMLFADLRGFTRMTDQMPGEKVVATLNDYFSAVIGEIENAGGQVLKLMGDGLLATFPLPQAPSPTAEGASGRTESGAVTAAAAALARIDQLNVERAARGDAALALDIALHEGEVMYGNVGAAKRLDFTVIGPAVNEATRMEKLCEELGVRLVLSAPVAAACGLPVRSLGRHTLRGVAEPRELFTLADRT